jgi:hypothetical protein
MPCAGPVRRLAFGWLALGLMSAGSPLNWQMLAIPEVAAKDISWRIVRRRARGTSAQHLVLAC